MTPWVFAIVLLFLPVRGEVEPRFGKEITLEVHTESQEACRKFHALIVRMLTDYRIRHTVTSCHAQVLPSSLP